MTDVLQIALCVGAPIVVAGLFLVWSGRRLMENPMISVSRSPLRVFLVSRFTFHITFGILIVTFLFAIIHFGMSGEQTRLLIATAAPTSNVPTLILSSWSNFILPILFGSIFVALFTLGMIGKRALRMMPAEGKPGAEFSGFRFTFLMMVLSLIIPPLIFGSLLLL